MKPITVATYFHTNEQFIMNEQLRAWASWPKEIKDNIECIAIHTGEDSIDDSLSKLHFKHGYDVDWKLYHIEPYKIWNQSGGRNLAFHLASNEWVAIMDADYIVPTRSAQALLDLPIPQPDQYYIYRRSVIASTTDLINYNIFHKPDDTRISTFANKGNIYIMSKTMFWDVGGNDEDFAGNRGFEDTLFLDHLEAKGYTPLTSNVEIQHYMKLVPNTGIRQARNIELYSRKKASMERPINPLRFQWREIL